ncbi:MAG: ATP-binding protein [Thermodesulfobacteriota bacterium]
MIARLLNPPRSQSFFLFGPRQTGKSTLIDALFKENIWKIDLLLSDQFIKYAKFPEQFRLEAIEKIEKEGIRRIFIDEIQRLPLLLNEIHHLIQKTECKFLLTGSSARKLKRGGANLLAGRAVQRNLFPYVHEEIAESFSLPEVLQFGTLPGVYDRKGEDKIDILHAYTETYLKEEILAEGVVRNLGGFSRFLDLAASQSGDLLSYNSIGRECHIPARTVQAYFEILEDTLIGFRLPAWNKSIRKRMVAHPKFFIFDLGVTNALTRQLTAPPDPVRFGRLFEQFIILETHRLLNYHLSEAALYFWRTNHGAEVDLLIEKHGRIIGAYEIKSTTQVSGSHLSGLRSFRQDHPEVPLHVVALVEHRYRLDEVQVLPWKEYLVELKGLLV